MEVLLKTSGPSRILDSRILLGRHISLDVFDVWYDKATEIIFRNSDLATSDEIRSRTACCPERVPPWCRCECRSGQSWGTFWMTNRWGAAQRTCISDKGNGRMGSGRTRVWHFLMGEVNWGGIAEPQISGGLQPLRITYINLTAYLPRTYFIGMINLTNVPSIRNIPRTLG
jgi:hypothetical protein